MQTLKKNSEEPFSALKPICIVGIFCAFTGGQDLAGWAEVFSNEPAWLTRVMGDWLEPVAGLLLVIGGLWMVGPCLVQGFTSRDLARKRARQGALVSAIVAGIAGVYALEAFVPSRDVLPFFGNGAVLERASRQTALVCLGLSFGGFAGFFWLRRKDAGFWKVILPVRRENEIWGMSFKAEIAVRAVEENREARRMLEHRAEFVQAEVSARFDYLCEPLIKESADLATIDSTARLQMDVGHVFKRYADFHRRLAEVKRRVGELVMEAAYATVLEMLEKNLPGQSLRVGISEGISLSISRPLLNDSLTLIERRKEWEETMRSVVSIGAEKGNQIVGEWLERAARGEISVEEVPEAAQALRALCYRNGREAIDCRATVRPALGY
jgi:hypothetical protein